MKKLLSLLLTLALCAACLSFAEEDYPVFTLGEAAPDFSVELVGGEVFTLSEALETHDAVMINIWATWCTPCKMEFPYMESAYNQYSDRIALVCLSPFDTNEEIAAYMEENGIVSLPMGADEIGISSTIVLEGYPTTIIIDKFGNYAYYECGSMLSEGQFTRMFDYFLSPDYTVSEIVEAIPAAKPDIANPSPMELTMYATDGSVFVSCDESDAYAWPFVPSEDGIVNSNHEYLSYSVLTANVSASEGDVLAFEYNLDSETMCGALLVSVNDKTVNAYTGITDGTCAYRFDAAGDYAVKLTYTKQDTESTEVSDTCFISGIRMLSGAEAEAAIAAQPVYPRALEGADLSIEAVGENMKEIVFDDPTGEIEAYFGDARFYVANDYTATLIGNIGADVVPELAFLLGDWDYEYHIISQCDISEAGYVADIDLSCVEIGGYSNTYCYIYDDFTIGMDYQMAVIFVNEENVNYFLAVDMADEEGNPSAATWMYADGTLPSTDAIAEEPVMDGGMYEYTIAVVDETGAPVTGVMLNVCTDETCTPSMVDENGVLSFEGALYPYSIHVLIVPEGYSFDTSTEFVMEDIELTIVVPHA